MTQTKEVQALKSEVNDIAMFASVLAESIQDAKSESEAVMFLGRIKDNLNLAKKQFDFLTKPLKEHIKTIKAEYDVIISPLEEAEALVKKGITEWRASETFKQKEAERIALEQMAKSAVRDGDIEKLEVLAHEHATVSEVAPKSVKTSEANMYMRKTYKFNVVSLSDVPLEYLTIDESKVKASIKEGTKIKGIESWVEMVPTIVG
jgi:hypothetical protein